ncbi:hypothetical protein CFC21_053068 [Triticum aestivum]|uniref:Uncharacterized protein n=3 Tax=Triticum TaxID=4564 RepID=A0A9R0SF28_TRITD|nr:hypothetical protein CFC21_053068 [Triticum aestivum]VAH93844.1 unnamed protein product [Triticum turgidum subsp. durum]
MQNGGGGWRLQGPDPCTAGPREADPQVDGSAVIAGDDEEGRSVVFRADPWRRGLLVREETRSAWRSAVRPRMLLLHPHHQPKLWFHDKRIMHQMFVELLFQENVWSFHCVLQVINQVE